MQPVSYNNLKLYKGAVFRFSFRLSRAGSYIDPSDVIFTASDKPGGTEVFNLSYTDSPSFLSVDDDNIWTVEIPATDTTDVNYGDLYMQVDAVEDGSRERWITGNIKVYQNATD